MPLANSPGIWSPRRLSILRPAAGPVFLEHGALKLPGAPAGGQAGADPSRLVWWPGPIELAASALLALGLFTRPAAFVASGMSPFISEVPP